MHCNKGVSRSSTVVAAYLMSTRGLTKDEVRKMHNLAKVFLKVYIKCENIPHV